MSEDIGHRQRRYLISMTIRTVCFVGAVLTATLGAPVWIPGVLIVGALILPYVSVVVANGGREPQARADFTEPAAPPDRTGRKEISGPSSAIRS
jgi:DUF3099 family protein